MKQRTREQIIKDFHKKYIKHKNGCWVWKEVKDKDGYGKVRVGLNMVRAHRFSYEIYNESIKNNLFVLHKCDNPSCVNPNHLFLGTNKDNMVDASQKGRLKFITGCFGESHWKAKLKDTDILVIRALYKTNNYTQKDLAKIFNVSRSNISLIVLNKNWSHIKEGKNK